MKLLKAYMFLKKTVLRNAFRPKPHPLAACFEGLYFEYCWLREIGSIFGNADEFKEPLDDECDYVVLRVPLKH